MFIIKNLVFITPAKTGSTSLQEFFAQSIYTPNTIKHKHDIHVPQEYSQYKKVLLVRNPYDWFISHYYWSGAHTNIYHYAKQFIRSVSAVMPYVNNPMYEETGVNPERGRKLTKKEVRDIMKDDPSALVDYIAFELQMFKALSACVATVKPDYILHLETIKEDLKKLPLHALGEYIEQFPHVNKSDRPERNWELFYTPELLYIVGPFLAQEAKALGYPEFKL